MDDRHPTLTHLIANQSIPSGPRPSADVVAFPAARVVYAHGKRPDLVIFHGGAALTYRSRDDLVDDVLRAADRQDFDRMPRPDRLRLVRQLLASIDGDA